MDIKVIYSSIITSSCALWIASISTGIYLLYKYGTWNYSYFYDQGIPGPKPLPFVGTLWGLWRQNLPDHDRNLVKKYGRILGCYDGSVPNMWVTDADLIRSIYVKDFDHFVNRRSIEAKAKYIRKMLSVISNQTWKDVRSAVTPTFTTGKVKKMSVIIEECTENLAAKFAELAQTEGKIDAKKEFGAFTMDVIARCAFGMKINDLGSKDDQFLQNASKVFNPPGLDTPLVLVPFMMPFVMKHFGELVFNSGPFKFFFNILQNGIDERKKSAQKYYDFIDTATDTILEYKKEENGKMVPMWTRDEIDEIVVAQSTLFLIAGFDTTATTMTNAAYVMATNPEVQERLYDEVTSKLEHFERINHEMILDFPYLDHVIHEVLRMYPPVLRIERACNKDVTYNTIRIKKGTLVTVSPVALHYDEDYYPDPEKFDPDRWNPENKSNMNPYAFMPFGMGPRNCVGMRFAMEELKIALATLVHQFRFFPVPETPEKMRFKDGVYGVTIPVNSTIGIECRS